MKCPICGGKAHLTGQPAGLFGASFRCFRCGPFESRSAEALAEAAAAAATSQANAETYRKR